jgi:hypothetical protein
MDNYILLHQYFGERHFNEFYFPTMTVPPVPPTPDHPIAVPVGEYYFFIDERRRIEEDDEEVIMISSLFRST